MDFKGKNILVTGAGGAGIGAGVCNVLSAYGATIIINELDMEDAEKAAMVFPNSIPIAADISKKEDVVEMFRSIREHVGVLHGLVNNAGVGLCKVAHKATDEEFNRLYATDVQGVWQVSKAFADQLLKAKKPGNIVNLSSVHAHSTMSGYAIYASAKSAVEGLTRGMAVELGPYNIRVNAVGPGYVHSNQNYDLINTWSDDPQQWVRDLKKDHQVLFFDIKPEDVGNVVAFLLSDLSRAVTGQTLYVDNGSTNLLYNRYFTEKREL